MQLSAVRHPTPRFTPTPIGTCSRNLGWASGLSGAPICHGKALGFGHPSPDSKAATPNDKLETVDSRALEQRIRLDFPSSVWQIGTLTGNLPNDRHAQQDRTMSVEPACVVHSADPNAGYALLLHRQRGVSMSVRASTMPA